MKLCKFSTWLSIVSTCATTPNLKFCRN